MFVFILVNLLLISPPNYRITISAGGIDRINSVISFPLPDTFPAGEFVADVSGMSTRSSLSTCLIQVDENGTAWMLLDNLKAGSEITLLFKGILNEDSSGMRAMATFHDQTIALTSNGRDVLQFYQGLNEPPEELDDRYRRGGYIHPVKTPSGTVLSGHLHPLKHSHHSGIWSAWTNTIFQGRNPDFWNFQLDRGRVDLDTFLTSWSGSVHAGLESVNRFTDLTSGSPIPVLLEHWELRAYAVPVEAGVHVFDLILTQTVNDGDPLLLPEYLYGGVGFRAHPDWDDTSTTRILTSEGLGRLEGHASRAKWFHAGGFTDGKQGGIAVLGHPTNFRFPQPMRLHPTEPFFMFAPTQLGDMSIQPGTPYVTRYRYVTYDGEPDAALIERLWMDFAYPVGVTVERQ
jgi:hypothetical protein